jgi:hypothetical protein
MEGSAGAPPAQGAPPAAQPPASGQGASGQGQSTGQSQGSSFNWGLFPSVPENQRELLQPHLTNVLGHVTRMEQQYAPYKGLLDAIQPDQVQGLLQFIDNYNSSPLETWMGLGQSLQQDGTIQNPNFSIEALQALVQAQQEAGMGGAQGQMGDMGDMPPWAQAMQQSLQSLTQFMDTQQQAQQAQQQAEMQRQNDAMLTEARGQIRAQLTAAGIPDGIISDEDITSALITHQGDMNAVVQRFTSLRDAFTGNFVNTNANGQRPLTINGAPPQAPGGGLKEKKGDGFRSASKAAEQYLMQANQAAAQGN